jgi:hypothetical protein
LIGGSEDSCNLCTEGFNGIKKPCSTWKYLVYCF